MGENIIQLANGCHYLPRGGRGAINCAVGGDFDLKTQKSGWTSLQGEELNRDQENVREQPGGHWGKGGETSRFCKGSFLCGREPGWPAS